MKKYTHTEEGKHVLDLLSHIISTYGMDVYKCRLCDDLFGSREESDVCGICQTQIDIENKY
jgi:peroxiredoxin family protein